MKMKLLIVAVAVFVMLMATQLLNAADWIQPRCDGEIWNNGTPKAAHTTYSQNPTTIKDSVRVSIEAHANPWGTFGPTVISPHPIVINPDLTNPNLVTTIVGDFFDTFQDFESTHRAFYSISVHPGYAGYTLRNVMFKVYQENCYGDNQSHTFPIWEDGSTCYLILAQVQYPLPFTVDSMYLPVIQHLGAMSTDNTVGWRELDVTGAYRLALDNDWSDLQFMLYFPINSDMDGMSDAVVLRNPNHLQHPPHFILTYEKNTSAEDNVLIPNANSISIYPNPISSKTTIKSASDITIADVELYNIRGQRIKGVEYVHKSHSQGDLEIKQQLPAGVYLLRCKVKNGQNESIVDKKVIIQ